MESSQILVLSAFIVSSMIGFGRHLVLVALASGLIAVPLRASELHCQGPETVLAPERLSTLVVSAAVGADEAPCAACAMSGCPASLCPGGAPVEAGPRVVSVEAIHAAAPPSESTGTSSRTLQPPTPPPNRSSLSA